MDRVVASGVLFKAVRKGQAFFLEDGWGKTPRWGLRGECRAAASGHWRAKQYLRIVLPCRYHEKDPEHVSQRPAGVWRGKQCG